MSADRQYRHRSANDMSKSNAISIGALAAVLLVITLTTATIRVDNEKVLFNACTGRLITLRQVILLYKERQGEFPPGLTNLVAEYVQAAFLNCPKLLKNGSSVSLVYRQPTSASDTNRWFLRSPSANYIHDRKSVCISITLEGKIRLLSPAEIGINEQ